MAVQSGGLADSFKCWEQQARGKGHLSARDQQSELDVQLQVSFDPGLHTGSFPGCDAQNLLVHRVCPGNSVWQRG